MRNTRIAGIRCVPAAAVSIAAACLWIGPGAKADDEESSAVQENSPPNMSADLIYSDDAFRELIRRYAVGDGDRVDYAAWQASDEDMRALDGYVELIGRISPKNHPERFASKAAARRYWINAYNALVIDSVLDYWPLDSVRDVRVSLTSRIVPGKGFFYDREFLVGGERTNLLDLEEYVLDSLDDPRVHFALNCASGSCPVLRPSDWSEAELERAARDFVNRTENVDVGDGVLYLSKIFDWYRKDFPRDIARYLQSYAEPALKARLEEAAGNDYRIRYRDYDWALNGVEPE